MPNVIGMTASAANVALTNAGLNLKQVNENNSERGTATVNEQTPEAGTMVEKGSVVSVQFSYSDNVH